MDFPHRLRRHLLPFMAVTIAILTLASAELAWPQATKPIKVVVPFPPGGGADILARLLAEQIGRSLGPTMLIENRPGAGTVLGTEAVTRAAPDGTTLLVNTGNLVIAPHLRQLSYDPLTGLEPVCHLVDTPLFVVVNASSSVRTLADFVSEAKMRPGQLTLASVGPATTLHIALERFRRAAGIDTVYVPFSGTAPAVNALLGGHVTAAFAEYPVVVELVQSGKLRALATGSRQRVAPLTAVPTIAESGYPEYEAAVWFSVLAPAKTPDEVIEKTAMWYKQAMTSPELKDKLPAQGFFPVGVCGSEFGNFLREQYAAYGKVMREANIRAE
jgi:tripartite-type tricarboxylate transporter receptor subunit TctC